MRIEEIIDKEKRICATTYITDMGNFTGIARCHPDDEMSQFFGSEIADARARIKMLKEIKKWYKFAIEEDNIIYNMIPKKSRKAANMILKHKSNLEVSKGLIEIEIQKNEDYIKQRINQRYGQK